MCYLQRKRLSYIERESLTVRERERETHTHTHRDRQTDRQRLGRTLKMSNADLKKVNTYTIN